VDKPFFFIGRGSGCENEYYQAQPYKGLGQSPPVPEATMCVILTQEVVQLMGAGQQYTCFFQTTQDTIKAISTFSHSLIKYLQCIERVSRSYQTNPVLEILYQYLGKTL